MKIIYVAANIKPGSSVYRKIANQVDYLNENGIETTGLIYSTKFGEEQSTRNITYKLVSLENNKTFFKNVCKSNMLSKIIKEDLKTQTFDYLFLRHLGASYNYLKLISYFNKKIFLYIPSNIVAEKFQEKKVSDYVSVASTFFKWLEYFIDTYISYLIFYSFYIHKTRAVVAYTPELCSVIKSKSLYNVKTIYNRDGAEFENIRVRKLKNNEEYYKLIFLKGSSTKQPWSGLDRLINSIEEDSEIKKKVKLYICGNVIDKENYNYDFIELKGYLSGKELDDLIDEIDLGVSNLANYLIGLNETTQLKSREYFVRGLPFIQSISMPDVDRTPMEKYYLKLPNDNSLIDMKKIISFIDVMRKDYDHPTKMNILAKENLSWKATVKELAISIKELD